MSEIKAQLYAGNPLSITDEELDRLWRQPTVGFHLEVEKTRDGRSGKGWSKPALYRVFRPALRAGGELTLAENVTEETARLILDGARYLHLVSAAIRELREREGGIDKAAAEQNREDAIELECVVHVLDAAGVPTVMGKDVESGADVFYTVHGRVQAAIDGRVEAQEDAK